MHHCEIFGNCGNKKHCWLDLLSQHGERENSVLYGHRYKQSKCWATGVDFEHQELSCHLHEFPEVVHQSEW